MSDSEEEEEEEGGGGEEGARQAAIRAAVEDGALVETDAARSTGAHPFSWARSFVVLMVPRGSTWHPRGRVEGRGCRPLLPGVPFPLSIMCLCIAFGLPAVTTGQPLVTQRRLVTRRGGCLAVMYCT